MKNPSSHEKTLHLAIKNLGCANCAAKMEIAIRDLPGINAADIDFAASRLRLSLADVSDRQAMLAKVDTIIHSIEKDACILDTQPQRQGLLQTLPWPRLIRFAAGLPVFAAAWLLDADAILKLALYLASWLIFGYDVLFAAVRKLMRREWFDEHFLMSAATIGALAIGEYPEAVAVMLFYQIGEICQQLAVDHSRRSIKALLDLRPQQAWLLTGGQVIAADPQTVDVGSRLLVRPGERVPLDGRVIEGESALDTAALTGESLPRPIGPGDVALAGCINGSGLLTIEVIRAFGESEVSRILGLVEAASARKASAEQFITRFAAVYTPVMVGLALLLAIIPPLILGQPFAGWISRALILLVISCPCALVLSVPLGYFAGIGAASSQGILVKGGTFLEKLASIGTLVLDKTGTLTEGRFTVTEIQPAAGWNSDRILELAAAAESHSSHPIALSILEAWQKNRHSLMDIPEINEYRDMPGRGILLRLNNEQVLLGNQRLMAEYGVQTDAQTDEEVTGTALYLAICPFESAFPDKNSSYRYAGRILLHDRIKPEAASMISRLRSAGVRRFALLSGDRLTNARLIAAAAGLDEVHADLLPEQKVDVLEKILSESLSGESVAYLGDGINDAPVLARADVGIALGAGSDAAIESADIVILGDDLAKVPAAIALARKTSRIVRQNVLMAIGFKAIVLALAVAGAAGIWQAVFADVGVAVLTVFNSLRVIIRLPASRA